MAGTAGMAFIYARALRAFGGIIAQVTSFWNQVISPVTCKAIETMVYGTLLSLIFDKRFVADVPPKQFNLQERCYQLVVTTQSRAMRVRKEGRMTCTWCGSDKQRRFTAEVAIHSPGLEGLEKPIVWVFPELFLCLKCGKAEILVPETELRVLEKSNAA